MSKRVLHLFGDIDSTMVKNFFEDFAAMDRSKGEITILLDSGGGDEEEGWALYDAIKQAKQPTRIIVYGQALSMAAAVLQAGTKRLMAPNSSFMIHPGWRERDGQVHTNTAIADGEWMKTANRKYLDVIAGAANAVKGTQLSVVNRWFLEEKQFTAAQAVQFGFADEIYEGALP